MTIPGKLVMYFHWYLVDMTTDNQITTRWRLLFLITKIVLFTVSIQPDHDVTKDISQTSLQTVFPSPNISFFNSGALLFQSVTEQHRYLLDPRSSNVIAGQVEWESAIAPMLIGLSQVGHISSSVLRRAFAANSQHFIYNLTNYEFGPLFHS